MGNRQEARFKSVLPVRVWWEQPEGTRHSQLTHTLEINRSGARLGGIHEVIRVGDVLTIQYKQRHADYQVVWVGTPGTRTQYQIGARALEPDKTLWGDLPSEHYTDDYYVSAAAAAAPTPAKPAPAAAAAKPATLVTPPAAHDAAKAEITRRLRFATEELCEIDELIKAGQVDPTVLNEFRDALALARHTAWGVQQWFELQERGGEAFPLLAFLMKERLVVATRLCHHLARDVAELSVKVEAAAMEDLINAVEELADRLAHLQPHAAGKDQATAEAERSLHRAVPEVEKLTSTRTEPLSADATMDTLARRALTATGADGIAIALTEGAEVVCRASAGIAPEAGVRWHAGSGLTGEALRLRKPVLCEDTESDPRVDPVLCRAANLRCCLIIPILASGVAKGTLEAYASHPRAFSRDHAQSLASIAGAVVSVLERRPPAPSE